MTRPVQQFSRLCGTTSVVVAAALLLWGASVRVRNGATPIEGTYTVKVAGYGKGKGTCNVGTTSVQVTCQVTDDDDGSQAALLAPNLKRDRYRFKGDGTLDGVHVQISGRVDPPDASTTNNRFSATFISDDGRAGRVVGIHD